MGKRLMNTNDETIRTILLLDDNCQKLSQFEEDSLHDIILLLTMVLFDNPQEYPVEIRRKAFGLGCQIALQKTKMDFRDRWTLYYYLRRAFFLSEEYNDFRIRLANIYADFYREIEEKLTDSVSNIIECDIAQFSDRPVVLITSQFLSVANAPTRRVLDYAWTINKLGSRVMIINDACSNLKKAEYFYAGFQLKYFPEYRNRSVVSYKGIDIPFYQASEEMPNLQEIEDLLAFIKKLNTRLVLNVGGESIVGDLCRSFTISASIPCSTEIPVSAAPNLILPRRLEKRDQEYFGAMLPWQHVVESRFNYIYPEYEEKKYVKTEFGVPDNTFVLATAGNRLDSEMTSEFLKCLDYILEQRKDIHYMLIGDVINPGAIEKQMKNYDRVHLTGHVQNGGECIGLADVYVQPLCKGGGRAAFEAMYHGIPVVTLRIGDGWYVSHLDFGVDDFDEMKDRIIALHDDESMYRDYRQKAYDQAKYLEDMEGMMRELFRDLKVPAS